MKIKTIKGKYTSAPVQVKATLWFMMCNIVQNGCRFLTMPFLVRLLTTEQYGIYSVFLSWIQIITIFATLDLHLGVYNNAMFKYPDMRDKYTAASQSLSAMLTLLCFAVYCMFSNMLDGLFNLDPKYTAAIFIQILFTESFLLWSARQRYEYKYKNLLLSTCILAVLYMVLPIFSAYTAHLEHRLDAVIYSGVLVQSCFGMFFMLRNYIKGKCFFSREFWIYGLKFNIPLIPHYLSGIILGQSDRIMISRYIGASQAGIYSFVYNISLVVNIFTTAINNAIVPYTYEKLSKRDYTNLRKIANFLLLAIGMMIVIFSFIAPELMKIIATEEYYEAVYLVPVISLSSYFTFLYYLFANVEFFFEANKFITVASCIGAATNIILNYLLMPVFGYFAAGYTTMFCYGLFGVAHYIFMRIICKRKNNGEIPYNGKAILIISLTLVVLAFGSMALYDYPIIRYAVMLIALIICISRRKDILNHIKFIITNKL